MVNEEFLRDVCPNHTDKSQWNKSELLHILELHKEQLRLHNVVVPKGTLVCTSCNGTGGRVIYDTYLKCKICNGSGAN